MDPKIVGPWPYGPPVSRNSHIVLTRIKSRPALYQPQTPLKEPETPFEGPHPPFFWGHSEIIMSTVHTIVP